MKIFVETSAGIRYAEFRPLGERVVLMGTDIDPAPEFKGGDPAEVLLGLGFKIVSADDAAAQEAKRAAKAAEEASERAAVKEKQDAEISAWLGTVKAPAAVAARLGLTPRAKKN